MTQLLFQYSYLQVLDFLTTIAFLLIGVQEGNPLVRWAMLAFPQPIIGLLVIKVAAIGLGLFCWHMGRQKLLVRINVMFALLVAWNMVALIVKMAAPHVA